MANIKVFENKKIRTQWDAEKEDWWFSAVDVVEVLTDSKDYLTARKEQIKAKIEARRK